ncbi:MAG TPA: glutaredoxin family protein [Thermomicrobiales bacterium]|nr:glutaredoxin family protein [Thermomicrobiales bacterium]
MSAENRPPIIMYGRTRFCPDVTRSRLRLEELGYEWTEYDVENDPARKDEMTALTGRGNVPTLVIGESILVEPSNDELDRALTAAGYDVSDDE